MTIRLDCKSAKTRPSRAGRDLPHVSGRGSAIINRRRRIRKPKMPGPAARIDPRRSSSPAARKRKAPELSLRGSSFIRSNCDQKRTGDQEAAGEAVRVAMPVVRHEDRAAGAAEVVDGPEEAARPVLLRALIHQLELEVEVGDRIPVNRPADDPAGRMARQRAIDRLRDAAAEAQASCSRRPCCSS